MPNKSGLLDNGERAIARRVRRVRYVNELSQPQFAKALGVSLNRVASIEYGRTPLTVELADRIAKQFDVNVVWLATGEWSMHHSCGYILQEVPNLRPRTRLSKALTENVTFRLLHNDRYYLFKTAISGRDDLEIPDEFKDELNQFCDQFMRYLDSQLNENTHFGKGRLLALLIRTTAKFYKFLEIEGVDPIGDSILKSLLTGCSISGNMTQEMKLTLKGILNDVRHYARPVGMQSKLAKQLGVPRSRVSEWLSGKREPSGEMTLALFNWVELQKRKQ